MNHSRQYPLNVQLPYVQERKWDLLADDSSYCSLQLVMRQRTNFQEKMNMWQCVRMSLIKEIPKSFLHDLLLVISKQQMCSAELSADRRQLGTFSIAGCIHSAHLIIAVPLASSVAAKDCRQKQGEGMPFNPWKIAGDLLFF